MDSIKAIVMTAADNVATVIGFVEAGNAVAAEIDGQTICLVAGDRIPFAHKLALRRIAKGEPIVKYGETIGLATADIETGRHVHVHNLESCRGRGETKRLPTPAVK